MAKLVRTMNVKDIVENVTAGGGWVWLPDKELCFCVPTKNGCSAVYGALTGNPVLGARLDALRFFNRHRQGPFLPAEVMEKFSSIPHLLSVRDPVDRFGSLWRHFCRGKEPDIGTRVIGGKSPDELMDYIEAHPRANRHWIPQSAHGTLKTTLVPYTHMLDVLGLEQVQVNVTRQQADDPPFPVDRIREHYKADAQLWDLVKDL